MPCWLPYPLIEKPALSEFPAEFPVMELETETFKVSPDRLALQLVLVEMSRSQSHPLEQSSQVVLALEPLRLRPTTCPPLPSV